ncbi:MAG: hypothetical protein IKX75_04325 [Desulfovibrio sp.]|nr:hypothetical protein [Desulfovibrio sp.]
MIIERPFFGQDPEKPEKPEEPVKPEKPEPPVVEREIPRGELLEIPEQAEQKKDLSFLRGCWASKTSLRNAKTGEAIVMEYCFNEDGKGKRHVRDKRGLCTGDAQARLENGKLTIESTEAACPGGRGYMKESVQCQGTEQRTQCQGREHDKNGTRWKADFRKSR